ncbi:MAG: 3-oxoacyl-ACP synthase III, partial [Planctomycetota bacterium]
MLFQDVCLSAMGVTLPNEVWSSDDLERMLAPVYSRLRLPEGRLELMTGIRQRRVWDEGTNPSGPSITSGKAAIDASPVERQQIGCLIHASVCRDFLEPATASRVHDGLSLPADCWVYDVSNACLGLLNGMV